MKFPNVTLNTQRHSFGVFIAGEPCGQFSNLQLALDAVSVALNARYMVSIAIELPDGQRLHRRELLQMLSPSS